MLELFRIYGTIELKGADKADKDLDRVDGKAKGIVGGIKDFTKGVGKVAAGIGVFALVGKAIDTVKQSLDGAIDRYDTLNNFPRVMEQIGFDAQTSQKAIDKLSAGIQGLPTRLDEVASTAQGIAIMTGDLDGAVNTTLALNNAFLASNASVQDASRGLDQYVQMMAKGEVDLQSWRTLQETMPYALRETAEAFGFTGQSATNDFYEALKDGEITFEEFNAKLIELDQAQGGFAETAQSASGGIKTAWTNMKTWVVMGVADIIAAIDDALGGTGSLEGAINSLKPIVQGVFGWIANTAIPAVATAVEWVREKFDEMKPTFETVKGALEPLFAVFEETSEIMRSQLAPLWESIKQLFESLLPILEILGALIGGVILTALIIWTSAMNGVYRAIIPIIEALLNLVDVVVNVVNTIIALLTGDFDAALEYWDAAVESSIEFFKNLWEGIVGFFEGIVDTIISWFSVLTGTSKEEILAMKDKVIEYFVNLKDESINKAKEFVKGIKDRFNDMKREAINKVVEAKNNVVNRFNELKTQAVNKVNEFKNNIKNKFDETKREMINKAKQAVTDTISKIGELPSKIKQKATEFFNAGKNIVTSIADGIKSAISKVTGAISDVASKVRNFLPFSPAKEGPLSDLDKLDFEGPIGDSIERGENTLRDKMMKLLGSIHPTASINVGGRGITTTSSEQSASTVATSQNNEMIGLLKEVVRAIREGKIIHVDGRILGEINDEEQGRRVSLSGRVAY